MPKLTEETKANRMRKAFGTLAAEYISSGRVRDAELVAKAATILNVGDRATGVNEHWARLYDILESLPSEA